MDVCILTSLAYGDHILNLCMDECERLGGDVWVEIDCLPDAGTNDDTLYISFLGDYIVPKNHLKKHMYNTHPGPPGYRGWGARLRTLQDNKKQHAVTLHQIDEGVDTGPIIKTEYFPVDKLSTTDSIHAQAEVHCLRMVRWLITQYKEGKKIVPSGEQWSGKPMLKKIYIKQLKIKQKLDSK